MEIAPIFDLIFNMVSRKGGVCVCVCMGVSVNENEIIFVKCKQFVKGKCSIFVFA